MQIQQFSWDKLWNVFTYMKYFTYSCLFFINLISTDLRNYFYKVINGKLIPSIQTQNFFEQQVIAWQYYEKLKPDM